MPTDGIPLNFVPQSETDHFMQCPVCKIWFDCRKLNQVVEHVHDGPVEITEG